MGLFVPAAALVMYLQDAKLLPRGSWLERGVKAVATEHGRIGKRRKCKAGGLP